MAPKRGIFAHTFDCAQGNENHCCYHISHFLSALPNPPDAGLLPRRGLKGQQATNQRLTRMHLSQPWLTMTVPFQVIFQGWRKKKCSWLPTALPWYTVPRSQKWRRHAKSPAQPQNIFNQSHFLCMLQRASKKVPFPPFFPIFTVLTNYDHPCPINLKKSAIFLISNPVGFWYLFRFFNAIMIQLKTKKSTS